jgi:hypothetical protein
MQAAIAWLEWNASEPPRSTSRVAGFQAQRGGIGGYVRPRLVDDADHAERHAHAPDLDPAGAVVADR